MTTDRIWAEADMGEISSGMELAIESGFYLPEVGGCCHSDIVVMTNNGKHNRTPLPHTPEGFTLAIYITKGFRH